MTFHYSCHSQIREDNRKSDTFAYASSLHLSQSSTTYRSTNTSQRGLMVATLGNSWVKGMRSAIPSPINDLYCTSDKRTFGAQQPDNHGSNFLGSAEALELTRILKFVT